MGEQHASMREEEGKGCLEEGKKGVASLFRSHNLNRAQKPCRPRAPAT